MNKKIAFIHSHDYYIEYTTSEKWNRCNPLVLIINTGNRCLSLSLIKRNQCPPVEYGE